MIEDTDLDDTSSEDDRDFQDDEREAEWQLEDSVGGYNLD